MDPSSLVFCAIVAMWAIYVLGRWRRRREQLAEIAAVQKFSHDWAQLPAGHFLDSSHLEHSAEIKHKKQNPSSPDSGPSPAVPAGRTGQGPQMNSTGRRLPPARAGLPPARRIMGIALLINFGAFFGTGLGAIFGVLSGFPVLLTVILGAILVASLRTSALRSRDLARRQLLRERRRAVEQRRRGRRSLIRGLLARRPVVTAVPEPAAPAVVEPPARADGGLAHVEAGQTWEPIPVPVPTYQLKARAAVDAPIPMAPSADRSLIVPGPPAAAGGLDSTGVAVGAADGEDSVPAASAAALDAEECEPQEYEFDLDSVLERRIAANG